jgi:hypothetical protein
MYVSSRYADLKKEFSRNEPYVQRERPRKKTLSLLTAKPTEFMLFICSGILKREAVYGKGPKENGASDSYGE